MRRKKVYRQPHLNDAGGNLSGRWFIEYGYRDPKSDKMCRKRVYDGFAELRTKKARYKLAEDTIKLLITKLERGWTPLDDDNKTVAYTDELEYHQAAIVYGRKRRGNKTITFYANEYITNVKNTKAKKTFESYRGKIRELVAYLTKHDLVENDIATIDNSVIVKFFDHLINEQKLARATVEKYKMTLGKFFRFLIDRNVIKEHPVYGIEIPETDEDFSAVPFLDEDMAKVIPEMKRCRPQLFLAAMLQYFCFVRPGNEMLKLKIKHINFSARTLYIPKDIAKKRRARTIDIPNQMYDILIHHGIHTFGKEIYLIGPYGRPGEVMIGYNTLRSQFNVIRDRLGLSPSYKWYSFKHTGAGKLVECGVSIAELMNQLGHSDITSTYRYIRRHFGEKSEKIRSSFPSPPGF